MNRGGGGGGLLLLFFHRDVPKILKKKNISLLEIDMGVNSGTRRMIVDIRTHFFLKLNPFSGGR